MIGQAGIRVVEDTPAIFCDVPGAAVDRFIGSPTLAAADRISISEVAENQLPGRDIIVIRNPDLIGGPRLIPAVRLRGLRRKGLRASPDVGTMGRVGFPDAELKIVSLIRYADACEPTRRHDDCPFAAEREGRLTCRSECREVLATMLRRGPGADAHGQAFDARQLRLSEISPTPDIRWHTSSLLQVLVKVARTHPLFHDGTFNLRRLVDATSALGALGCRGLDPDRLVRRGVAQTLKLSIAGWLEVMRDTSGPPGLREYYEQWRAFLERDAAGEISRGGYLGAALYGSSSQRLDAWIESAPLEDVLCWRLPGRDAEVALAEPATGEAELWTWIVERFTRTYLDRWSLSSLKLEYKLIQGSWHPDLPSGLLSQRVVPHQDAAKALADRALMSDDVIDAATMVSLIGQALTLIGEGQRRAAAALFEGACRLKPADLYAKHNQAFCILLDEPEQARAMFTDVLDRGIEDRAMAWCNLALAESLLGNGEAALRACEQAYVTSKEDEKAYLWRHGRAGWSVETTSERWWAIHFGAELERTRGITGGVWAKRLERLTEYAATSEDPSSTGTDEEGL